MNLHSLDGFQREPNSFESSGDGDLSILLPQRPQVLYPDWWLKGTV